MIRDRGLSVFLAGVALGYVAHAFRVAANLDEFAERLRRAIARRDALVRSEGIATPTTVTAGGDAAATEASRAEG